MKYEPFSEENLGDVLRMALNMQRESDYAAVPFDIEQTARSVLGMVINNPNGFGVLAYKDGKPVGMICGGLAPYVFSRGWLASDYAWYVLPEHRGSSTAVRLLKMFRQWAVEKGATELYMGVTTNVDADRTGQLLQRLGFYHVGGNYRERLNVEP
jgi:GNAT superfamily N-acetyltransferase